MNPVAAPDRLPDPAAYVVRRPGIADGFDAHLALLAFVVERERRRRAGSPRDGNPERGQLRQERRAVVPRAADGQRGAPAEQTQRAGGVVRPAADARRSATDEVAREIPDHAERPHARSFGYASATRRRATEPTASASAKAAAKLGSDAPPKGSAPG